MPFEQPKKVRVMKIDLGHTQLLGDLEDLITEAKDFEFHDFKNEKYATPKMKLREKLFKLAENVVNGIYDN